jgi:hypothetical protein
MNSSVPPAEGGTVALGYVALRIFGFVMLLLMLASIIYSGFIAIANWGEIRV